MARNMQPVLKKCRTLGLDPVALGVNKKSKRNIRANANKKLTEYGTQLSCLLYTSPSPRDRG